MPSRIMSFTLTDTQAVPALQLLQQPVFQQHRSLRFFYQHIAMKKWVKTNAVQLMYSGEGRKGGSGTNTLIITLGYIRCCGVTFTLRPN
jgi:hypothetical protein